VTTLTDGNITNSKLCADLDRQALRLKIVGLFASMTLSRRVRCKRIYLPDVKSAGKPADDSPTLNIPYNHLPIHVTTGKPIREMVRTRQ
jgi:hypothetical protein